MIVVVIIILIIIIFLIYHFVIYFGLIDKIEGFQSNPLLDLMKNFNPDKPINEQLIKLGNDYGIDVNNVLKNLDLSSMINNKKILDAPKNINKISKIPICKFMSSENTQFTCPIKYNQHMGAMFGAKANSGINCNGHKLKANTAKAIAIVKDGTISRIKIIDPGKYYNKPPKIRIIGNGKNAKAYSIINKQTNSLKQIKISNCGYGYQSSPKILIGKPNMTIFCHLCCQLDKMRLK